MTREEKLELLGLLEEQRRRNARNDLNDFCRYIQIPGAPVNPDDPDCEEFYPDNVVPAEHHKLLNNTLMKVEAGEIRRLMVFMPPGSAKSTYATVAFPPWFMGKKKGRQVISTSYGTDLATRFGRKCRHIVGSPEYRELFDCGLMEGNRAAHEWATTNLSTYLSAGILAGITGNRADGVVIDDPIKGREEADSPTIREKVWQEYLSSIRTRLKPGAFIVIIQTRWHADDLSGRILPADWSGESGWVTAKDGEKWYVLCLAAQCERDGDPLGRQPGEWLWPEWFTPEHWEAEKRAQGSRNWAALYQQRPTLDDGGVWVLKWFKRYNAPPEGPDAFMIVQSWDTGVKPQQINDPSVCSTWLVTTQGYYKLHTWRKQVNFPDLKRTAINLAIMWRPDVILIEDKASGQSLIQELQQVPTTETKGLILSVIPIEPEGDKLARAQGVAPLIESGRAWLPERAEWLPDYEAEVMAFPVAPHDDQVDADSQALKWMRDCAYRGIPFAGSGQQRVGYGADSSTSGSSDKWGNLLGTDTSGFIP